MEIRALAWRETNVAKLRAHRIEPDEVQEIVDLDAWVSTTHDDYPDQVRIVGPTNLGRLVTIALAPTTDPAVWRPVTGWRSTDEEMAYYFEEMQRLTPGGER
ncbi:MAG: hypothetical protein HY332_16435 [Chloroflexi bacterium]|nr:hypothetical protein [Chloroflexota bacterium]